METWVYFDDSPKEHRYYLDPIPYDYSISVCCFFVLDITNPSIKNCKSGYIRDILDKLSFLQTR